VEITGGAGSETGADHEVEVGSQSPTCVIVRIRYFTLMPSQQ
jgi:hypothetical protein